jgi:predicted nucleic acid-binding protein
MTDYVVDASVAVKWLVAEDGSVRALDFLQHAGRLIAPELVVVEVATALSRRERVGEIPPGQAQIDLETLPSYFDALLPAWPDARKALEISLVLKHPFSDCLYLALAMRLGHRFITADNVFAAKVTGTPYGDVWLLDDNWLV